MMQVGIAELPELSWRFDHHGIEILEQQSLVDGISRSGSDSSRSLREFASWWKIPPLPPRVPKEEFSYYSQNCNSIEIGEGDHRDYIQLLPHRAGARAIPGSNPGL